MASMQDKTKRVRPPRVHIRYDVHTGGAIEKVELPFMVGVMADLSGQRKEPLPRMAERKFIPVDRDNFNEVLRQQAPRLVLRVKNRLTDEDTLLPVELTFNHVDDFEPDRVAQQIEPLRKLLEARNRIKQLESKIEGKYKAEQLLQNVLTNTEKALALAKEMGIEAEEGEGQGSPASPSPSSDEGAGSPSPSGDEGAGSENEPKPEDTP
jgi:type VI secretion system protein ImpB